MSQRTFSFGNFRLVPGERTLLESGRRVPISSRALDLLTILVDHPGELLSKKQLIAHAWPDTRVEENNLRVHIGALRKLLGKTPAGTTYIATVPGRGYSFVGSVEQETAPPPLPGVTTPPLPAPLAHMIGRTDTLVSFLSRLNEHRLVTIVGPGGIGKTTVALAVAERFSESREQRAGFVDLSPLADPQLLVSALASIFGIPARSQNPVDGLIAFLHEKRMLLVLDSCEHIVDAAAAVAEALLKGAPGVRILATSREPLGVEGECVQHLAPLGISETALDLTAAQALTLPAVQLFVERAANTVKGFELSDADAPAAVEVCRKLDGIPLAIELAAARVGVFGIQGLAERLKDSLTMLTHGRRTAPPRHKTLRATLDWSYCTLSVQEQQVLKRLAIFSAEFNLDSASAVASSADIQESEAVDVVASLASKSLLVTVLRAGTASYRMLDTTRAYAREKLLASPEFHAVSQLHAENCSRYLSSLRPASAGTAAGNELMAHYARTVDDVRTALRWCFSSGGKASSGVALTAVAASLFMRLCLYDEYRGHVERALKVSEMSSTVDAYTQMSLHLARGHLLLHMAKPGASVTTAFDRALDIAEGLNTASHRARALAGAWLAATGRVDYHKALELAERFQRNLEGSAVQDLDLAYSRMMALPLHYLGKFDEARRVMRRALDNPVGAARAAHDDLFYIDLEVVLYALLARNSWIEGSPDQARDAAQRSLERATSTNDATGIVYSLVVGSCPVALWRGDFKEAARLVSLLKHYATQFSLGAWLSWTRLFEDVLRGAPALDIDDSNMLQVNTAATLRDDHLPAAARLCVDTGGVGWNAAEVVRVAGEQLRKGRGSAALESAEKAFLDSLEIARRQGALSWELRTATSLARLWRDQHRNRKARELLAGVLGRFTEGFQTQDYTHAHSLLREFGS